MMSDTYKVKLKMLRDEIIEYINLNNELDVYIPKIKDDTHIETLIDCVYRIDKMKLKNKYKV